MHSPPGRVRRGPITSALGASTAPARPTSSPGRPAIGPTGSARGPATSTSGPASPKRSAGSLPGSPPASPGVPPRLGAVTQGVLGRGASWTSEDGVNMGPGPSQPMSRVSSYSDPRKELRKQGTGSAVDPLPAQLESPVGLFHIIQQLAAAENALWNILDGLKSNTTHSSFFCREYWGCSCSQAQLSLERLPCQERLKRQVQQACVLESLSLGVASHLCSGVMQGISVTIRSRLRNLLYYIHENCLVLLDMVCQRWMMENQNSWQENQTGHCPENLNLDILVRVKRYRRLRKGEHVMALRQHNEMIVNVVRQLCRGAAPKRPPLSSRGGASSPGDRSPGAGRGSASAPCSQQVTVLTAVNDVLTARGQPLDRLKPSTIRSKMLQYMCFKPLLNVDGADPDCPWPTEDPYVRYGTEQFAQDGPIIWFEPLPPMLPNLEQFPKLPPPKTPDAYTLVLDLDETLVHYFEHDGMGNYDIRPGMHEFLERMNHLGYELVIFTAATQDYADWVIDQIDPSKLIHHRLYRQHALPWGPIFVKDMSRLGRDLDRTLIIDNVQENFMLQPNNGIFICTWYDDPHDTALFALTPLLDELIATRAKVPEILDKYRDQIPTWAGFDQFSQLGGEYSEFGLEGEDGLGPDGAPPPGGGYPCQEAGPPPPVTHAPPPPAQQAPPPQQHYLQPCGMHQYQQPAPAASPPPAQYMPQPRTPQQPQPPQAPAPPQQQQPQQHGGYPQQAYVATPAPAPQQHEVAPQPQPAAQQPRPVGPQAPPQAMQQHQQVRPAAPQQPGQPAQPVQRPQAAPQPHHGAAQHPGPAFSTTGVAGPYQAPPPAHPQHAQHHHQAMHQPPVPGSAVPWGRAGIGGPYQAPRPM